MLGKQTSKLTGPGWVSIGSTEIDAMVSGVLNILYFLQLPYEGNIFTPLYR